MKKLSHLTALVAVFNICAPLLVNAMEPDSLIITATRTPQTADASLASVTLITRGDINAIQPVDVAELLRFYAGIDIARNGGAGKTTSVFMRGTESNHTLVLVDGVKINPGTIGGAALQNLSPDIIDRIEVVRGPRSVLYGSEAIGGVIQIFTRRGKSGTTLTARAGMGSEETKESAFGAHHVGSVWRVGLDTSYFGTDGFPAREEGTDDSGHRNTNLNTYAGMKLGKLDIELAHWQTKGNTEYFDFLLDPLDQDFLNTTNALTVKSPLTDYWATTLKYSHMRDEIDQQQSNDFAHTRRSVIDWQNDIQLGRHNLLTAGIYVSREDTSSLSFGSTFDVTTDTDALFVQNQWQADKHRLLTGWRHSDHDSFGTKDTGDIAYGYQVSPAINLRTSMGTGFRAPDSTDRFGFGGNPNLNAETSLNIEGGANFVISSTETASVTVFQNDIDDLIVFEDPDGFLGPIPGMNQNVEKARIRGLETGYHYARKPWDVTLEMIIQNPVNRITGRQLARRAKHSITAGARYAVSSYLVGTDLLFSSHRPDSDFSTTINPEFTVVSLFAQKKLARDWTLHSRVENLFDRKYTLADGFNSQGRALYVEVRYHQSLGQGLKQ